MQEPNSTKKPPANNTNAVLRFAGMAFQMGAAIFIGVMIGKWLDGHFQFEKPYMTLLFALLFTLSSLYLVIKDVMKS